MMRQQNKRLAGGKNGIDCVGEPVQNRVRQITRGSEPTPAIMFGKPAQKRDSLRVITGVESQDAPGIVIQAEARRRLIEIGLDPPEVILIPRVGLVISMHRKTSQ